jgi:hypothetical protein
MIKKLLLGILSLMIVSMIPVYAGDQEEITDTFDNYLKAVKTADYKLLEKTFTENYFKNHGGKESWKKNLPKISQSHQKVSLGAVKIAMVKDKSQERWGQFTMKHEGGKEEPMGDNWYLLIKDSSGQWKIDEFFDELDPEKLGEKP